MKKLRLFSLAVCTITLLSAMFMLPSCTKTELPDDKAETDVALAKSANANGFAHTKQYSSEVATDWFNNLTEITRTKPYFVGQAVRILTYSSIALYESVVPGMPSYQSIYQHITGNVIEADKKKDYYWPACANAAIARVSSRMMQAYPAPDLTAVQALEAQYNAKFAAILTPEQLQFSDDFGKQVGDIIYAWSSTDGTFNPNGTPTACAPYVPLGTPGSWEPTAPFFFPAVGQCQANLRTFIPNIINTVLADPPPAYSTDPASAFYAAAKEVYTRNQNMTDEEKRAFSNWRDLSPNHNPVSHMVKISTAIFIHEKLNLEDVAVLYAKQNMAASDAVASVFKSKFHYALIRPIPYIRNVLGHAAWLSYGLTPQTPSYPDELSVTEAAVTVLEEYFGSHYAFTDRTHESTHGVFTYNSLSEISPEITQARLSGGTIFGFSGEAGIIQGRKVGALINALPFKKP